MLHTGAVELRASLDSRTRQPSLPAQYQIGFGEAISGYGVGERDDFKRHLLLGRARNLLPFERDERSLPVLFGNDIDKVPSSSWPITYPLLSLIAVAAPL